MPLDRRSPRRKTVAEGPSAEAGGNRAQRDLPPIVFRSDRTNKELPPLQRLGSFSRRTALQQGESSRSLLGRRRTTKAMPIPEQGGAGSRATGLVEDCAGSAPAALGGLRGRRRTTVVQAPGGIDENDGKNDGRPFAEDPEHVRIANGGATVQLAFVKHLWEQFQDMKPDDDGLIPISRLTAKIMKNNTAAQDQLRTKLMSTVEDEAGKTPEQQERAIRRMFNFHDLLKMNFPRLTMEDSKYLISICVDNHSDIATLDPRKRAQAEESWSKIQDNDGVPLQSGLTYAALEDNLIREFPYANVYQVMKSMEPSVFQKLIDGGEMVYEEYIMWYANKLTEKTLGPSRSRGSKRRETAADVLGDYLSHIRTATV